MPHPDDHDIRPPLADDNATAPPESERSDSSGPSDTSEIAMRLSVLGKLIIPPTAHR
jgi:hypothetical protein